MKILKRDTDSSIRCSKSITKSFGQRVTSSFYFKGSKLGQKVYKRRGSRDRHYTLAVFGPFTLSISTQWLVKVFSALVRFGRTHLSGIQTIMFIIVRWMVVVALASSGIFTDTSVSNFSHDFACISLEEQAVFRAVLNAIFLTNRFVKCAVWVVISESAAVFHDIFA
jgi:hypothetical protein